MGKRSFFSTTTTYHNNTHTAWAGVYGETQRNWKAGETPIAVKLLTIRSGNIDEIEIVRKIEKAARRKRMNERQPVIKSEKRS